MFVWLVVLVRDRERERMSADCVFVRAESVSRTACHYFPEGITTALRVNIFLLLLLSPMSWWCSFVRSFVGSFRHRPPSSVGSTLHSIPYSISLLCCLLLPANIYTDRHTFARRRLVLTCENSNLATQHDSFLFHSNPQLNWILSAASFISFVSTLKYFGLQPLLSRQQTCSCRH